MDIKVLQEMQKQFDLEYFPGFWQIKEDKDFLNSLKHIAIALAGEVGEFSNIVKKIDRIVMNMGGEIDSKFIEMLKDELIDIFIYVLIGANLLGIDLGKEYLKRLEYNKKRFSSFRNG